MKKALSITTTLMCLVCLCLLAQAQTQVVANGKATQPIILSGSACVYNWINSNPSIGLPASGTGDISSFMAVNNGNSAAYGTITATPVNDPLAFVPLTSKGIAVINTNTDKIVNTISLGGLPAKLIISPDGNRAYVTCPAKGYLYVIDTRNQTAIDSIHAVTLGNSTGIAISPDGVRLYIATTAGLTIVNTTSRAVSLATNFDDPLQDMVVSADGKKLYAVGISGAISVINTSNNLITSKIPARGGSTGITISHDGNIVYVANSSTKNIYIVKTATDAITDSIPAPLYLIGLTISKNDARLYASTDSSLADDKRGVFNTLVQIDIAKKQQLGTTILDAPRAQSLSITPDGNKMYVIYDRTTSHMGNIYLPSFNLSGITLSSTTGIGRNFIVPPSTGCGTLTFNYIITPTPTTPTIITTGTPAVMTTKAGTASAASTFTASAYKLTEGIRVVAPAGFEISTDNVTFSNTTTLGTSGDIPDTKIYVRLPSSAAVGRYSGNIKLSSSGAPDVLVAVSGEVSPTGSVVPNITVYNGAKTPEIVLPGTNCIDIWRSDVQIGLKSGDRGRKILPFTASNPGTTPITATVSLTLATDSMLQNSSVVFIANQVTGKVWLYDHDAADLLLGAYFSGADPYGVAINNNRSMAYVSNRGDGTVSVTKLVYLPPEPTIPPIPGLQYISLAPIDLGGKGKKPQGIAVTPGGRKVYVANSGDGTVSVINAYNNTLATTINIATLSPCGVVISPDGSKVYVSNTGSASISVISTATDAVIGNIPTGSNPQGIAISPDGSKLYVANGGSNSVSVINTADNSSTTIPVGSNPLGITLSVDGSRLFVTNQASNNVSVINTANNTELKRVSVGGSPSGVSVTPDGTQVYVCCLNDGSVYKFDTSAYAVTKFDGDNLGSTGAFSFGNFVDGAIGCATPTSFTITVLPTPPGLTANGYLANLTTSQGVASAITSFNVSGLSLSQGIGVTAPAGYEVSADSVNFSKTITIGVAGNVLSTPVFVRLAASTTMGNYPANITLSSPGATNVTEPVNGTVTEPVAAIVAGAATGTVQGCAGSPSTSMQQIVVSAVSLRGTLTAVASAGFEVSLSPTTGFTANLDISNLAIVPNTIIYVRAALTAVGRLAGNITISTPGVISKTIAVAGIAYPTPTINPVNNQTIVAGGKPSLPITFTGTGNTYKWVNDRPDINLDATGTGDIAEFVGINNTNSNIVATVTATPVSTTLAYVANMGNNSISVIDVATNALIKTITVGSGPRQVIISADATRVYTANGGDGTVSVINTGDNTVVATVMVGQTPSGLRLNADNSVLSVFNGYDYTITTINTITNTAIQTIPSSGAGFNNQAATSPDNSIMYEIGGNNILVADAKTGKILQTIPVGTFPQGLSITPDGKTLYVANAYSNTISVINTGTYEVVSEIKTPNYPVAVVTTGGTGCSGNAIQFTITVEPIPPIILAKGKLDSLGTIQGNPSRSASFTVSGTKIKDAIKATAPAGFEVSTDNINFNNSITFGAPGTVVATTVYVRLAGSTAVGKWSGDIILTSQGADNVTMPTYPVNNVTEPVSSVVIGFVTGNIAACGGSPSASPNIKQFMASGYLLSTDITVNAPKGFEVSVNATGGYSTSLVLPRVAGDSVRHTIVYVRSAASALGSISGTVDLSATGARTQHAPVSGVVSPLPTADQVKDQALPGDQATTPVTFTGTTTTFSWINDNTKIGLASGGFGNVASFKAVNQGSVPLVANVTVTPIAAPTAYIANSTSNSISVVNTGSNTVVNTIFMPTGTNYIPYAVAISPDGRRIYTANQGNSTISEIDPISGARLRDIPLGFKKSPYGMVISPDGRTLYTCNGSSSDVSIVDIASGLVLNLPVGNNPRGIIISPDGSKVYAINSTAVKNFPLVSVINTATNSVIAPGLLIVATSNLSSPQTAAISPDGGTLYISNYNGSSVSAVNTTTGTSVNIPVGVNPSGLVLSNDGKTLYVANNGSNTITIINATNNTIITSINVGRNPSGVSITPDGSKLYVVNTTDRSLSIINTLNNQISTMTGLGGTPVSLGNFISASAGCTGTPMVFKFTVNPSSPYITPTGALTGLNTVYGTPSASTSFSVSGISMTAGILVTPPGGFEVSTDNKTFNHTVSLGAAGTITPTTVYTRLAATTAVGTYSGNIVLSSQGAADSPEPIPVSTVITTNLTVTAVDKAKSVGTANPVLTVKYSGFVNGDTQASLTILPVLSTTATQSSPVGQYPIDVGGAASTNYTFTYVPGVLTVNLGEQQISIPNAFTPNGDGVNDTWQIPALATYANFTVAIFNRLGQSLYYSNNYPIPWDGTYKGAPLPTGVYYYIINIKGASKPFAGEVVIIR